MERDNAQLTALVEQRLRKLNRLAHEIEAGQQACVVLDLEELRNHDKQKERLCTEIRLLDLAIRGWLQEGASDRSLRTVAEGRELDVLLQESEAARVEVARLNRVYALFLERSGCTLKVMANVVSHCLGVYPRSEGLASTVTPFERSV